MKEQGFFLRILSVVIIVITVCALQPCMALIVTEVMYHPVEDNGVPTGDETLEFIELYNNRAIPEDIGKYAITNGVNYTFPIGTIIDAKCEIDQYFSTIYEPHCYPKIESFTGKFGFLTARGQINVSFSDCSEEDSLSWVIHKTDESAPMEKY